MTITTRAFSNSSSSVSSTTNSSVSSAEQVSYAKPSIFAVVWEGHEVLRLATADITALLEQVPKEGWVPSTQEGGEKNNENQEDQGDFLNWDKFDEAKALWLKLYRFSGLCTKLEEGSRAASRSPLGLIHMLDRELVHGGCDEDDEEDEEEELQQQQQQAGKTKKNGVAEKEPEEKVERKPTQSELLAAERLNTIRKDHEIRYPYEDEDDVNDAFLGDGYEDAVHSFQSYRSALLTRLDKLEKVLKPLLWQLKKKVGSDLCRQFVVDEVLPSILTQGHADDFQFFVQFANQVLDKKRDDEPRNARRRASRRGSAGSGRRGSFIKTSGALAFDHSLWVLATDFQWESSWDLWIKSTVSEATYRQLQDAIESYQMQQRAYYVEQRRKTKKGLLLLDSDYTDDEGDTRSNNNHSSDDWSNNSAEANKCATDDDDGLSSKGDEDDHDEEHQNGTKEGTANDGLEKKQRQYPRRRSKDSGEIKDDKPLPLSITLKRGRPKLKERFKMFKERL